jgi:hypothetical protein
MRGREHVVDALREADEICINAIVLGELLGGFARGDRMR